MAAIAGILSILCQGYQAVANLVLIAITTQRIALTIFRPEGAIGIWLKAEHGVAKGVETQRAAAGATQGVIAENGLPAAAVQRLHAYWPGLNQLVVTAF